MDRRGQPQAVKKRGSVNESRRLASRIVLSSHGLVKVPAHWRRPPGDQTARDLESRGHARRVEERSGGRGRSGRRSGGVAGLPPRRGRRGASSDWSGNSASSAWGMGRSGPGGSNVEIQRRGVTNSLVSISAVRSRWTVRRTRRLPGVAFLGRGGVDDVDMHDASPVVREDQEDEQDLAHHRGHDEDVHGDEAPAIVVENGSPALRWRPPMADDVLGDRRL